MRILLIVDCYLPHTKSSATLIHDLALELRRAHHQVTVLAPDDGVAHSFAVTCEDGLKVARVRTGRLKGVSRIVRAFREALLSDLIWARARHFFETHPHDAIVFYSPSIFFGKLVRRLKQLWVCPTYLIVRDIFPQWALDAGLLRRGPAYYFFKLVEMSQYAVADVVGVQSPANLGYFEREGIRPRRLEVLYNWACVEETSLNDRPDRRSRANDKLVFFFGGNMGVAQDMDAIVRLAVALRDRPDVCFLLVGDGSEAPRIKAEIAHRRLHNVVMHPPVDQKQYSTMLSQADVGLLTLNGRLTTQNVPGKLLGYLRSGIPVLSSLNPGNDLAHTMFESRVGISCVAGDDAALRQGALALIDNPKLRQELGENGRTLLRARFSAEAAARQILGHFTAHLSSHPRGATAFPAPG